MASDKPYISVFPDDSDLEDRTAVVHLADLRRSSMPTRPDRHVLVRMDASHVGQVLSLEGDEYLLGRHPSCQVVLTDDGVSRKHARIRRDGDGFVLEDLQSANGTFVHGKRIEHQLLADGDVFQLGPTALFRYTFTDSSQERMLQQLYEASVKDALTGAYNREHFDERLKMEVAYARRHDTIVSLVMFDLDHFKQVNDAYGHPAGDLVLIETSRRVASGLRTEDVFARYGGEEFAVILRGIDLAGAAAVGDRLRLHIAAGPVPTDAGAVAVSASVGVASLSCCDEPATTTLVAIADRRLYLAKRGGRNRVISTG